MNGEELKKICNKVDYNTYVRIQSILGMSSLGMIISKELMNPSPIMKNSLNSTIYAILAIYCAMTKGRYYTKDINQIRDLYNTFLINYDKLNKIFDLNNPVEIYTMFNYLIYKGYLSKDKEFFFSSKQSRDLSGLTGADIITGKGVCRHISAMLTDILNTSGIESARLGVCSKNYILQINNLEQEKYTREELVNYVRTHIIDEDVYKIAMEIIKTLVDEENKNIEISFETSDEKNVFRKLIGNHAISYAYDNGISYFLDPTQNRIYRKKETEQNVLYDSEYDGIPIKVLSSITLNDLKKYKWLSQELSKPNLSISKEEEQQFIEKTLEKCENNQDIFEKFYSDNSELYDDITEKVLSIKRINLVK